MEESWIAINFILTVHPGVVAVVDNTIQENLNYTFVLSYTPLHKLHSDRQDCKFKRPWFEP